MSDLQEELDDVHATSPAETEGGEDDDDDGSVDEKRLVEEYKLLQMKIDRIGDFRFRVKGWAITLVLGLVVLSAKVPREMIAIGGLFLIGGFGLLEWNHSTNLRFFGARLLQIEARLSQNALVARDGRPLTSRHLAIAHTLNHEWSRLCTTPPSLPRRAGNAQPTRHIRRPKKKPPRGRFHRFRRWCRPRVYKVVRNANLVFYALLLVIVVATAIFAKREVDSGEPKDDRKHDDSSP